MGQHPMTTIVQSTRAAGIKSRGYGGGGLAGGGRWLFSEPDLHSRILDQEAICWPAIITATEGGEIIATTREVDQVHYFAAPA